MRRCLRRGNGNILYDEAVEKNDIDFSDVDFPVYVFGEQSDDSFCAPGLYGRKLQRYISRYLYGDESNQNAGQYIFKRFDKKIL